MDSIIPTKLSYISIVPKILDEGFLCFAETDKHVPFPIKRFYYIFDVTSNAIRGKHAHKQTEQMLFCLRGSITMVLDNGIEREEVVLDQPNHGIFLDKMMWHDMKDFTKDTLLLVVASDYYFADDYIRDYDTFLSLAQLYTVEDQKPVIGQIVNLVRQAPKALGHVFGPRLVKHTAK